MNPSTKPDQAKIRKRIVSELGKAIHGAERGDKWRIKFAKGVGVSEVAVHRWTVGRGITPPHWEAIIAHARTADAVSPEKRDRALAVLLTLPPPQRWVPQPMKLPDDAKAIWNDPEVTCEEAVGWLGVSDATLRRQLGPRTPRREAKVRKADQIAADYVAGVLLSEIAAKYGVDQSCASKLARRRGLPLRDPDHKIAPRKLFGERLERARALWFDRSLTDAQIAAAIGMTAPALRYRFGLRGNRTIPPRA
jgi:hypothetical protein